MLRLLAFSVSLTAAAVPLMAREEPEVYMGKTVAQWIVQLGSDSSQERFSAAHALAEIGKPAVPALAGALRDSTDGGRMYAALALGMIGPEAKEALPALAGALVDPERNVRSYAASAMDKVRPGAKGAALIKALLHENPEIRKDVAKSLRESRYTPAEGDTDTLVRAFVDTEADVSQFASDALAQIGVDPVTALVSELADRDSDIREFLGLSGLYAMRERAMPSLFFCLRDENPEVREIAASALGLLGPRTEGLLFGLAEALKNPNADVRLGAVSVLAAISHDAEVGDPRKPAWDGIVRVPEKVMTKMVDLLTKASQDEDQHVREAASQALKKLRS